ncbi:MAG: hypothetical protein ABSD97_14690 [Acidimicrobiales bacterium]
MATLVVVLGADLTAGFNGALAALVFAPDGLAALAETALEDFCTEEPAFAGAFVGGDAAAFFAVTPLAAVARGSAPVAAATFSDDSTVVLATAGFADALGAFAFTTAPFFVSAGTTVVGTIGLSCRGEGDRR